jgi:hypothetical protein
MAEYKTETLQEVESKITALKRAQLEWKKDLDVRQVIGYDLSRYGMLELTREQSG